ncbi:hypothetical protein [Microbulbifer marinus]
MRRPDEMGKGEVNAWLGHFALQRNMSVSTQKSCAERHRALVSPDLEH